MGFFTRFKASWNKTQRLRALQTIIAPEGIPDFSEFFDSETRRRKAQAMEDFLDLCESDPGIKQVMAAYDLTREELSEIPGYFEACGLGGWVRGHYVPLSSIAFVEPLVFILESKRQGKPQLDTLYIVNEYWEGKYRHGALLKACGVA